MEDLQKGYIGYKGFNHELRSTYSGAGYSFTIGETYTTNHKGKPRVCSSEGFHYCDTLEEVFSWYKLEDNNGRSNRYCKVEILGEFSKDVHDNKCCTTSMKILEEVPKEEILKILNKKKEEKIEKNINLDVVKIIQTSFPTSHIGGSTGLFLHGIRLDRWKDTHSHDIDICLPYFQDLSLNENIEFSEEKPSFNDFDLSYSFINQNGNYTKIDVKIDPHQKYEIVEYKGFKYKVSKLETILEAKIRYSGKNQQKHKNDLREMLGLKNPSKSDLGF